MYDGYINFEQAAQLLPPALRQKALALDQEVAQTVEELRLRIGQPLSLTTPMGEQLVPETLITAEDLEQVLDAATEFSRYTAAESLRQGWLTAPGGLRIGVCGHMAENGISEYSSLAVRIPHPKMGIAASILPQLMEGGHLCSTWILSPPGGGKTTLLRDLVRLISDGTDDFPAQRVSLVDERRELAATHRGAPGMDVGRQTDVLSGLSKAQAIPILLRAMNPQVIALDEVALEEDVSAVLAAAGCGAALLATAHAPSVSALQKRPMGAKLMESGIFLRAVVISGSGHDRVCRVETLS